VSRESQDRQDQLGHEDPKEQWGWKVNKDHPALQDWLDQKVTEENKGCRAHLVYLDRSVKRVLEATRVIED